MYLLLKIQFCFVFMAISMHTLSQSSIAKPGKRKTIVLNDPVRRSIDSLKQLLTGNNLAIQSNPANKIYQKKQPGLTASGAERVTANCSYFCGSTTLPVTGLELEGERLNETTVKLNWKTDSEIDNQGFYIERIIDPASPFISRGFVAGAGNSNATHYYQRNDFNDFDGISYYRIRQVDINGRFAYSNVVAVKGYSIKPGIFVFPNPGTNSNAKFRVSGFKTNEAIEIKITDILGRSVATKKMTSPQNLFSVPLSGIGRLSSGFYLITIENETKKATTSFVITE
jgi:hypothetical protein